MKIFITGATGFIGKQLLKKLIKTSHKLVCLVRKNNPFIKILKESGIEVIEGDIREKPSLTKGMDGCDWVINLANIYSFWEPKKANYWNTNVEGTKNVMQVALDVGVSKVVHISSVVSYGKPAQVPFNEESLPGPVMFSNYAKSKSAGDKIAWDLFKNRGLPLVMIYPVGVIGPGDIKPSGVYINRIINRQLPATVFNDSILTWVYVGDVADSIIKALEKPDNIGERYLIGKFQHTFKEFNQMISEIAEVSLPKISIPDFLSMLNAYILTGIANFTKIPPLWDMSIGQMKTMKEGFIVDGSKAERDLGISYTPIRKALEEQIRALKVGKEFSLEEDLIEV